MGSAREHPEVVSEYLTKELELGRMLGQFPKSATVHQKGIPLIRHYLEYFIIIAPSGSTQCPESLATVDRKCKALPNTNRNLPYLLRDRGGHSGPPPPFLFWERWKGVYFFLPPARGVHDLRRIRLLGLRGQAWVSLVSGAMGRQVSASHDCRKRANPQRTQVHRLVPELVGQPG